MRGRCGGHAHLEMVPCGSHEECAAGKSCACTASAPLQASRASTPSPPALPGLTSTHRFGHVGLWCVLQVPVGAWAAAMARAWGLVHLPPDRESAARVLNTSKPASRPSPTGNSPNFPHPALHPNACAQWLHGSEAWDAGAHPTASRDGARWRQVYLDPVSRCPRWVGARGTTNR